MAGPTRLRKAWCLLALLCTFTAAWHLWALSVDNRLRGGTDSYLGRTLALHVNLRPSDRPRIPLSASLSNSKDGPIGPLLGLPLLLLIGYPVLALRLLSVLAHYVMMLQCFDLGRHLLKDPAGGLWSALLCATTPVLFGYARLTFYDPMVAVAVLGSLQLMLRVELNRLKPALALGLMLGLGALVKLSFVSTMVAPVIWLMARRLRSRRRVMVFVAVVCVAAAVSLPWYALTWSMFEGVVGAALASVVIPLTHKLRFYASIPGVVPLLLLGSLAGILLWRAKQVNRWDLTLLLTFVPTLATLTIPPPWGRFLVPILPLPAVLAGVGVASVQGRLPAVARRPLGYGLAAVLLVAFVGINLSFIRLAGHEDRDGTIGMLRPDQRTYTGYSSAIDQLARFESAILVATNSQDARDLTADQRRLERYRRRDVRWQRVAQARHHHSRGGSVSVLLIQFSYSPHDHSQMGEGANDAARWLARQARKRLVGSYHDPDGIVYAAYRVGGAQ